MKRFFRMTALLLIIAMSTVSLTSCMTHRHVVGSGATVGEKVKGRQWYALWGLVKIGDKDTHVMAGDSADYTIETKYGAVDWLVNFFLGWLTLRTRTVTVIR